MITESRENTVSMNEPTSVETVDKSIDCTLKVRSVRTQYKPQHFKLNFESSPNKGNKTPITVKLPKPKKKKDVSANTELSFSPFENVSMNVVKPYESTECTTEESANETNDDSDKDYEPEESDSEEVVVINRQNSIVN